METDTTSQVSAPKMSDQRRLDTPPKKALMVSSTIFKALTVRCFAPNHPQVGIYLILVGDQSGTCCLAADPDFLWRVLNLDANHRPASCFSSTCRSEEARFSVQRGVLVS